MDVSCEKMIDDEFIEKTRLRVFEAMKKVFETYEKPADVEKTVFIGIKSIEHEKEDENFDQ